MPTQWRIISLLLIATVIAAVGLAALPPFAAARPALAQACGEVVVNGGFETDGGWTFSAGATPPQYVTFPVHSGSRSLKLGITSGANAESYSSARQTVTIPSTATSALLTFWWYPSVTSADPSDIMELLLLSPDGLSVWARPWSAQTGAPVWNKAQFDLSAWAGQTFQIYFNVLNDGFGGTTGLFLDDVSLSTCGLPPPVTPWPTATPTWTPWPTPWPSPWPTAWPTPWPTSWPTAPVPPPTGCVDLLVNGSFDSELWGWTPGNNPLPPSAVADPVLSPPFAAEMGARVRNLNSYSSIRQTVTVPFGYDRTFIGFWTNTWAESFTDADSQQFVILGPGNVVWATPWKVLESDEVWQQHLYEMIGAPAATFDVYFAAVNDGKGGRTLLRVDDVHVWACANGALPPAATTAYSAQETAPFVAEEFSVTPEPTLFVAPEASPEVTFAQPQAAGPEAVATVQVVPFESMPPADARSIGEGAPAAQATVLDVTGLPTPEWTEVVIGGQSNSMAVPIGGLPAMTGLPPMPTSVPGAVTSTPTPRVRLVGTIAANPNAVLTQAVSAIETVAPSPTRLPFGLLNSFTAAISERTAQWPIPWQWVLGILAVVVFVIVVIWLIRRRNRKD